MDSLRLLDSARHKLLIAAWHADELVGVLQGYVSDDLFDPRRIVLEGHLEGLAYTGTAAAEKTIRALDPNGIRGQRSVEDMIRAAKELPEPAARVLASRFETWWMQRGRTTRYAQAARDLRNDAAHAAYEKTTDGPRWIMSIRGRRDGVELIEFTRGYRTELDELAEFVAEAERLAAVLVE